MLSQRASYITPLKLLTGIDPAQYNNLQTVQDQNDFRATVRNRIQNILGDYPNTSASGAGELGGAVLGLLDAGQNVQQRVNDLQNLLKRVDIKKWQNVEVSDLQLDLANEFMAYDILVAAADVFAEAFPKALGDFKSASGAGVIAAVVKGTINTRRNYKQVLQNIEISNVRSWK